MVPGVPTTVCPTSLCLHSHTHRLPLPLSSHPPPLAHLPWPGSLDSHACPFWSGHPTLLLPRLSHSPPPHALPGRLPVVSPSAHSSLARSPWFYYLIHLGRLASLATLLVFIFPLLPFTSCHPSIVLSPHLPFPAHPSRPTLLSPHPFPPPLLSHTLIILDPQARSPTPSACPSPTWISPGRLAFLPP